MNQKNTNTNDPVGDDLLNESSDPADVDDSSSAGEGSDGADSGDPGKTAGDSKERDPVDSTTPADNDDSKTNADANNFDDVLDALTNPKEATQKGKAGDEDDSEEESGAADDDETESADDSDDADAEGDGEAEDKTKENAEKSDPSEVDPELDPTPEERKRLSRSVNKKLDKLLKLKGPARFGEAVATFAEEAGFNVKSLRGWMETGKRVNRGTTDEAIDELVNIAINVRTNGKAQKMSKAERAQTLRDIANKISPAPEVTPEVITVPQDLAEAVSEDRLSQEEAEMIARARSAKAKGNAKPAADNQQQAKKETEEPKDDSNSGRWYSDAEFEEGRAAASKVYKEYAARYKADWPRISKLVLDAVAKESVSVHPAGFARLVRDKADLVIARLQKPAKKPPKSPAPTNNAPPKKKVDESDWTENDLLDRVTGKKSW